MKIGIDLDGVCFNFEDSLRAYLVRELGFSKMMCPDPTRWDFHNDWGLSYEDFKHACNEGVNAGYVFLYGDPYPGVVEGVNRIKDMGHSVHVITARAYGNPGIAQLNTDTWLAKHKIPYDTITYARDKTVVPTDFMIDDAIHNYEALEAAGTCAVLMDRAWNRGTPEDHRRMRALDMRHFADMIEEAS